MNEFIKLLEDTNLSFNSRETVLSLTDSKVTDHERGRILGKIEMLTHLMREVAKGAKNVKDSSVRK